MGTRIEPTVGRVVLFVPNGGEQCCHMVQLGDQPLAATVAFVHASGHVNLSVADHAGQHFAIGDVVLIQEDEAAPDSGTPFCHWMQYQLGQAAKTEEAEKAAKKK